MDTPRDGGQRDHQARHEAAANPDVGSDAGHQATSTTGTPGTLDCQARRYSASLRHLSCSPRHTRIPSSMAWECFIQPHDRASVGVEWARLRAALRGV